VIPLLIGFALGYGINRWWAFAIPPVMAAAFAAGVDWLWMASLTVAGMVGVAIGMLVRRRVDARRARRVDPPTEGA
jgi:hypothetical protein